MLQIVLIRPGSTDFDQQGRIQGTLDLPLCECGQQQAQKLAEEVRSQPIEAVYASPSDPAKTTAAIVAKALQLKVKPLASLANLNHGLWQGMLRDDIRHKHPKVYRQWQEQPDSLRPPEGETVGEAQTRVAAALAKLQKKHRDGVVALVVPEPLASLVHQHFFPQGEMGGFWHGSDACGTWEILSGGSQPIVHRGVSLAPPAATNLAAKGPNSGKPPVATSTPQGV